LTFGLSHPHLPQQRDAHAQALAHGSTVQLADADAGCGCAVGGAGACARGALGALGACG
jgi:hypothetical protein